MRKSLIILLVLAFVVPMGLFAGAKLGVNVGYGETFLRYKDSSSQNSTSQFVYNPTADDRSTRVALDFDYLFSNNLALNLEGDVGFSKENNIGGVNYTPETGYGAKAGLAMYLYFLRLGAGLRYQVTRGNFTGGEMSIRSFLATINVDILINVDKKSSLVIGAEYGYPLSAKMVGKVHQSGSLETSLSLDNAFFQTGEIFFYGGYKYTF